MSVDLLEHVTILCTDLQASRDFYTEVIGLKDGDRPPFNFPGAWLYAGGTPVIHLVGGRPAKVRDTGPIDHVALRASDLVGMRRRLKDNGVEFTERTVPGVGLHQVFVNDPDGVVLEFNFPAG